MHILLVEDEDLVRFSFAMALRTLDRQVTCASSAEEALVLFRPGLFNLVITDQGLPQITGHRLAAALKLLDPDQPIILITADPDAARIAAARGPFACILEKPLALEDLHHAVATCARTLPVPL